MPLKRSVLTLLLSCLSLWGQQSPIPPELTLDEAVSLAMTDNRQIKRAALDIEKAEQEVIEARTERLPQFKLYLLESQLLAHINFDFPEGQFGTFPGIGPVPPHNTSISTPLRPTTFVYQTVTQPLSQLHRISLGIQEARVNVDLARETLRQQRQTVADQVRQSYYAILQSQSALKAAHQAVTFYTELDQLTERYLARQVVLKSDALTVKTQLAKAKYQVVTLQDGIQSQQEDLNELLGRDLQTEFRAQAVPEPAPYELDVAEARRRALDQRPEVREARLKMKQARLDERAQRAQNIPDISLSFQYLSPFNVNFLPKNIASVGLTVNWEFWDWGRKRSQVAQKVVASRQADLGEREAEQQVLLEVGVQFRTLAEARSLLEVNQMARQEEDEKLRVVMNQYGQNAALLKETLQQETSVASAAAQYEQAVLSFWKAKADLAKAMGEE